MTIIEEREVHERFPEAGASEMLDKEGSFAEILAAVRKLGTRSRCCSLPARPSTKMLYGVQDLLQGSRLGEHPLSARL